MAMSGNTKIVLGLGALLALAVGIQQFETWNTQRTERAQARANIARAEARSKAAADAFAANKATIIADALRLADTLPADALRALEKYEAYDDAAIKNAIADVRVKIRDFDVARARKLMAAGDSAEAYRLLLAHNKPGAPAEIGALFDQIRTGRDKAEAKAAKEELAQRRREGVQIGMTAERVLQSSWGRPEQVNRTVRADSVREQWVYPGMRSYLYFENGILTTIQN